MTASRTDARPILTYQETLEAIQQGTREHVRDVRRKLDMSGVPRDTLELLGLTRAADEVSK